jgi:hypothetical protein
MAFLHGKLVHIARRTWFMPSDVFPTLEAVIANRVDRDEYQRRTNVLRRFLLDAYLEDETEAFDYDVFVHRVTAAATFAENSASADEWVHDMYQQFGRVAAARRDAALRRGSISKPTMLSASLNAGVKPSMPLRVVRRLVSHLPASSQQRVLHTLRRFRAEWHLRRQVLSKFVGRRKVS